MLKSNSLYVSVSYMYTYRQRNVINSLNKHILVLQFTSIYIYVKKSVCQNFWSSSSFTDFLYHSEQWQAYIFISWRKEQLPIILSDILDLFFLYKQIRLFLYWSSQIKHNTSLWQNLYEIYFAYFSELWFWLIFSIVNIWILIKNLTLNM